MEATACNGIKRIIEEYLLLIGTILIMSLCGCENNKQNTQKEEPAYDWRIKGFSSNENPAMAESRFLSRFKKWDHVMKNQADNGTSYVDSGVNEDFFWYLSIYKDANGNLMSGSEGTYLLETYRVAEDVTDSRVFKAQDIGISSELGYIVGMDYAADKYVFRWAGYDQNDDGTYRQCEDDIIVTDLEGNNSMVDFYSHFLEDRLEEYTSEELPLIPCTKCRICENNMIWVLSNDVKGHQRIVLYELNGKKVLEKETDANQYFMQPILNQEKELFLPILDSESKVVSMLWIDTQGKTTKELGQISDEKNDIAKFCGMSHNKVYYEALDPEAGSRLGIVQWDVSTGERTWILGLDVGNYLQYKTWWTFSDGEITSGLLTWEEYRNTTDWVVKISNEGKAGSGDLRVADFTGGSDKLKKCASAASMENPGITYRYEDASSEDKKSIILMELSENEGPDLMFVSIKDFYDLCEKQLLLDVTALISEKNKNDILPGALQIGQMSDGLMGLPIGVHVETLMIGRGVGEVPAWNLESVTDLIKQGRLNSSIWSPYIMNSYLEPISTVQLLINHSMNDSFLIDWKARTSHFNDDRFVQLLETTKTDMSKQAHSDDEENDLTWVYLNSYVNLIDFMASASDKGEIVGFPEQSHKGGYLVADQGILVVNKNCSNMEAVSFFLDKMLSKGIQSQQNGSLQISILRFEPKDYITTEHDGKQYYFNTFLVEKIDEMDAKSNPILLARDFLDDCQAAPNAYYEIRTIMAEELQSYYANEKDAKSVADVINHRVQIYLSEQ